MRVVIAAIAALTLGVSSAQASVVDVTTLQLNGSATASANDLNLGDGVGGKAFSAFLTTSISTTLGPQVYLGFTGGAGLSHAFQDVTDWDLTLSAPGGALEPEILALMLLGFAGAGAAARMARRRQRLALA